MLVAEGLHHHVLAGLDWTIAPGSRTVLLGPANSGKSTLLGVLSRAVEPRRGRVYLAEGGDVRRAVGWLPQRPRIITGLTVAEHVAYVGWLKGLSRRDAADRAAGWINRVGLGSQATHKAAGLTPVRLPRLALAEALTYDARYVFLDGVTDAMTPPDRDKFWNVVHKLPRTLAVVVSSTRSNEVVQSVDAVGVLVGGALRFAGTRAEFLGPVKRNAYKQAASVAYRALLAEGGAR